MDRQVPNKGLRIGNRNGKEIRPASLVLKVSNYLLGEKQGFASSSKGVVPTIWIMIRSSTRQNEECEMINWSRLKGVQGELMIQDHTTLTTVNKYHGPESRRQHNLLLLQDHATYKEVEVLHGNGFSKNKQNIVVEQNEEENLLQIIPFEDLGNEVVCDDFNVVTSLLEKVGGRDPDLGAMDDFNQFIHQSEMIDAGYVQKEEPNLVLKTYNWEVYGNIYKRVFDAEDEVTRKEADFLMNNSDDVTQNLAAAKFKLSALVLQQEIFLREKETMLGNEVVTYFQDLLQSRPVTLQMISLMLFPH
ncbi:unnamed protein product [Dovyalis caffra]|uniref:Uncharacterized protein n=1 Tax=Dovyalis caffra TaxID=77055 RepID=A0AAV1QTR4_9ROSI|nr:unnamed protein product [Dovyalis caffra]